MESCSHPGGVAIDDGGTEMVWDDPEEVECPPTAFFALWRRVHAWKPAQRWMRRALVPDTTHNPRADRWQAALPGRSCSDESPTSPSSVNQRTSKVRRAPSVKAPSVECRSVEVRAPSVEASTRQSVECRGTCTER
ncbi:UNVERIFIED_CONTAM: hypothetical protein FKN15_040738 [Acipenser sinensis]